MNKESVFVDFNGFTLEGSYEATEPFYLHIANDNCYTGLTLDEAKKLVHKLGTMIDDVQEKILENKVLKFKISIISKEDGSSWSVVIDKSKEYKQKFEDVSSESLEEYYETGEFNYKTLANKNHFFNSFASNIYRTYKIPQIFLDNKQIIIEKVE